MIENKNININNTANAIEYRHIKMDYDGKNIIPDFNLEIKKGEFVTVIGSSGCGKTTILKMANALISPTAGEILIDGKNIREYDLIALRRNIGYAIQGSVLFPHMSVEKNIAFVPSLLNKNDRERTGQAVRKWVKIVGLDEDILSRYPAQLSGGQQQRVGIARALAASPDLLLMDEPFGAVDEITRANLQDEILRIYHETGITILFVTHDINEALKLGTKIIMQYADPEEIRAHPANDFVKILLARAI